MANDVPALLGGIGREMRHLAERQRVISQNIANSETPGFKARDVATPDFADLLAMQGGTGQPRVARPRVALSAGLAGLGARPLLAGATIADADVAETKPDGNNVTLEDQLLKMGKIQQDFAAMTNLYRKQLLLLKTALGSK